VDAGAGRDALRPRDAARPSRLGGLDGGRRPAQGGATDEGDGDGRDDDAEAAAARRDEPVRKSNFGRPHAIDATSPRDCIDSTQGRTSRRQAL